MDNRQIISEIIVQFLGFLIVFAVLKRFAWSKLLGAIDARKKKIEDEFSGIEHHKKSLAEIEKSYKQKIEKIEEEARAKIQEAANTGLELAKDIQAKAREDAQKMVDRARAEIAQDIAKAKLTMRDEIVELSSLITEKIIREKLDENDHKRLVDQFLKELEKVG